MGREAQGVDGKVCGKKVGLAGHLRIHFPGEGYWSCVDVPSDKRRGKPDELTNTLSKRFGDLKWHATKFEPKGKIRTGRGWPGTENGTRDTADGVAFDFSTKLLHTEKSKVAGILSKTVSGAEVVERS